MLGRISKLHSNRAKNNFWFKNYFPEKYLLFLFALMQFSSIKWKKNIFNQSIKNITKIENRFVSYHSRIDLLKCKFQISLFYNFKIVLLFRKIEIRTSPSNLEDEKFGNFQSYKLGIL